MSVCVYVCMVSVIVFVFIEYTFRVSAQLTTNFPYFGTVLPHSTSDSSSHRYGTLSAMPGG